MLLYACKRATSETGLVRTVLYWSVEFIIFGNLP